MRNFGSAAAHYHAKMSKADKEEVQSRFKQGDLRVVAATSAFGMGIDASDVRFVSHTLNPQILIVWRLYRAKKKSFFCKLYRVKK